MRALIALLFLAGTVSAQGTFRIFDDQMNDVTGGVLFVADTNVGAMLADLTVENTDSVSHNVTAGQLIISQPGTWGNAIIWNQTQYLPSSDTSLNPEPMNPAATLQFVGNVFTNGYGGTSTINYCFWETTDMNNNSCVTATVTNYLAGIAGPPLNSSSVSVVPNPASAIIGVGWYNMNVVMVNLYSSTGELIESREINGEPECGFDVTALAPGIYMISCVSVEGFVSNSTFVH